MTLTADRVSEIFLDCFAAPDQEDAMVVDVIVGKVALDKNKLEGHRMEIADMLAELPDNFRVSAGGGWSFLQACVDRHGNHWTGMHARMAELFALGVATDQAVLLMPRELWDALPGGMPYYAVKV